MITLGLDPSLTNFGWCLFDGVKVLERGRFKTKKKGSFDFLERYMFLRDSVRNLCQTYEFDNAGIEHPVFGDRYSEGMYGLFLFSCEALRESRKDTVFLAPMQVKAHARDALAYGKKWKMQKGDMVLATKKKLASSEKWDHNEADAFWVACISHRFWNFYHHEVAEDELNETEYQQFARVHTFKRGKKKGTTEKTGLLYKAQERFFRWSETSDKDMNKTLSEQREKLEETLFECK